MLGLQIDAPTTKDLKSKFNSGEAGCFFSHLPGEGLLFFYARSSSFQITYQGWDPLEVNWKVCVLTEIGASVGALRRLGMVPKTTVTSSVRWPPSHGCPTMSGPAADPTAESTPGDRGGRRCRLGTDS